MKKGFTLIEVIVTATILAMALSSMLFSFAHCRKAMINHTHRNNAALMLNQQLENIQNQETDTALESAISKYYTPQRVYTTWNQNMTEEYYLSIQKEGVLIPALGSDLTILTATVTWEGGGPGKSLSMSVISNEPN